MISRFLHTISACRLRHGGAVHIHCFVAIFAGAILLVGGEATAAEDGNLLENGKMLDGGPKGVPGWNYRRDPSSPIDFSSTGWVFDEDTGGGSVFIKFVGEVDRMTNNWWWQKVVCKPNTQYRLTVEARSEGTNHRTDIGVDFLSESKDGKAGKREYKALRLVADTQPIAANKFETEDWKQFTVEFTTPPWANDLMVRLFMRGKESSEAWFRNVRLEEI